MPSTGSPKVDAVVEKAAAAAPGQLSGVALYSRFALAGAICCSVTHGALTPVDVYVDSPLLLLVPGPISALPLGSPAPPIARQLLVLSSPMPASLP